MSKVTKIYLGGSFFLCKLDIFVWIQHGCLNNKLFTLDPSNHVIKRLWCMQCTDFITQGCGNTMPHLSSMTHFP